MNATGAATYRPAVMREGWGGKERGFCAVGEKPLSSPARTSRLHRLHLHSGLFEKRRGQHSPAKINT